MNNNKLVHWLLGGALFVILILIVTLVLKQSQADTVTTTTEIPNASPVIDSIYISSSTNGLADDFSGGTITPNPGATKTLHINGVARDDNGEADITNVEMAFFRDDLGTSCTSDQNNCYHVTNCTLSPNSSITKKYDCEIALQFFADATDVGGRYSDNVWKAWTIVTDSSTATGISSTTKEVATILSVNIPNAITYGTFSLGAKTASSTNQEMVITQKGNDEADVNVSGSDMACTDIGTIPVANQKWVLTDLGYDDGGTALSGTPTDTDLNVGYRDDQNTDVTKSLYWNIEIPATGVKGVCTGSSTIAVIAH